jgi:TonB-dependent starch-binding outer membrane protein SusC
MKKYLLTCFALVFALSLWAQDRTVSGKVTATEDGSPLPGVNVVVKGTTNGTVTDADGNFKLTISGSGSSLVFSFIGLATADVLIGERTVVDVSLGLDVTQLSEVVVTGTGVATERRKLAISVESVSADLLPSAPTASIDQALVGKIAGAQISSVSGAPGAQVQILLRGINTIQGGTTPMILVDGIQLYNTSLNTLDLSSVERVEVVQGAAAATIYGAQGANGVIQIFTKKGKKGKPSIDFSTNISQSEFLNIGNLKKAELHGFDTDVSGNVIDADNGNILAQDSQTLQWSGSLGYDALDPTRTADKSYVGNLKYYDHFKQAFAKANTTNTNIRISGASDKIDYAFSVSNNHQESNFKNGGYNDRTNFTSNIGIELLKGLSFRSITQLAYTDNTTNAYVYGLFNARPFVNFDEKNSDGFYAPNTGGAAGVNGFNPNYWTAYSNNEVKTVDVIQNFSATYKLPKFVELDMKYGLNWQSSEQIYSRDNETNNQTATYFDSADGIFKPLNDYNFTGYWYGGSPTGPFGTGFVDNIFGEIDRYQTKRTFQNWISKATINFDFEKDFNLSLPIKTSTLVSFDWRKNIDKRYSAFFAGFPTEGPFTEANASSTGVVTDLIPGTRTPLNGEVPFITYGYLVNQRVDYGDLGGFSVGFRSDYSSAFGSGSKPFTFPRGDAYFRISGLDFWDNTGISNVLLEWKLRAAFGKAGIQPTPFDRYITVPAAQVGGESGFKSPIVISNPDLQVEISQEIEIGSDLTFNILDNTAWLNNINLSITYWKRSTKNAIWNVEAPPSSGSGQITTNAFSLSSNGFQASLSTKVYHNDNFSWNFTTNFTKATSEITDVLGGEVAITSAAGSTGYILTPNRKIGQLFGYLGLHSVDEKNPATGNPYIAVTDQANYVVASNGWVVSRSTKQPYFTPDLYSFGDPNPKFNMSFINDFSFKGFLTFGFQLDWVNGSHLYNQTKEWMYRDGIHSDYNNPISIDGETGAWTAFYRGVYAQVSRNGTKNYFYEDASFLRLRNVNVGVDIAKLLKVPLRTLQLVFTGRNLWTKTNYTGLDPEISSGSTNSSWDRAVDHNTLPNFKSYQIGLNIGF